MKRVLIIVVAVLVAIVLMAGGRWYRYVSNTDSPYDEIGIELNRNMPEPLRVWGCEKLQATFRGAIPPYGCQGSDGTSWI